jgi:hypothetical protein
MKTDLYNFHHRIQEESRRRKIMRKNLSMFLVTVSACTLFAGCGSEKVNQEEAVNNQTVVTDLANDQTVTSNSESDNSNSDESLPKSYVYTTADNIIPMSESATVDGVTYQILNCEKTSEFGNRNLENLNYLYDEDSIDDKGNLSNGNYYIFITFQYTNTTDSEVEILRGDHGICSIDDRYIVGCLIAEPVYIDEYWNGGEANEVYHYKLAPGESLTSESGYIICSDIFDDDDKLYFKLKQVDCETDFGGSTDPNAIFIDLEY